MCTLAIYFQVFPDYPVVIAANRDEFLSRPALPPTTLLEHPHVVGGKDLQASGTWLGINEYGLIAGLLNRRRADYGDPDPKLRSRGLLCLDALRHRTAAEAAAFVRSQRGTDYNAFNLLVASRDATFVAYNRGGALELVNLEPGMHLLTNLDVNDFECPRISRAYERFAPLCTSAEFARDPIGHREELARLLADHSTQLDSRSGRPNALCLHMGGYGTRSASMIFEGREPGAISHFFAAGPPCTARFEPAPVPVASAN
jgi:uncharacterized protein with NRDE domain